MSEFAGPEGHRDLLVVDADTHLSEPWDLWTARGPAKYRDRLPKVKEVDGQNSWVVDDKHVLTTARAVCVVDKDGEKQPGSDFLFGMEVHEVDPGASQIPARLEVMNRQGVWAHLMYPNAVGFGGQQLGLVEDIELRNVCMSVYNDAMAEMQDESGNRVFPMAVLPWWDIDATVREIHRAHAMGLVGVNTTSTPHDHGFPDMSEEHWRPMYEALEETGMVLNFHIGASASIRNYALDAPWPTRDADEKTAIGSTVVFLLNARVIANLIYGGIPERHPNLKIASVESGVGWMPFFLQALDHQLDETAPKLRDKLSMMPSDYFRRQMACCFWFEKDLLIPNIEWLGVDNCLFESDYPHPTCLYPEPVEKMLKVLEPVDDTFRRKVMGGNAARFYNLPLPV